MVFMFVEYSILTHDVLIVTGFDIDNDVSVKIAMVGIED